MSSYKNFSKLNTIEQKTLTQIIYQSNSDKFLNGYFDNIDFDTIKNNINAIIYNNEVVGYFIPRYVNDNIFKGYYRTGPIYIIPKMRNKNIAFDVCHKFFIGKKGLVWISNDNLPSISLYVRKLKFKKSGHKYTDKDTGETGEFYIKSL